MHDALAVSIIQRIGDLGGHVKHHRQRNTLLQRVSQAALLEQLHHQEQLLAALAYVVQRDDPGMVQIDCDASFAHELLAQPGVARERVAHHFYRYRTSQHGMGGAEHLGVTARTKSAFNRIRSDVVHTSFSTFWSPDLRYAVGSPVQPGAPTCQAGSDLRRAQVRVSGTLIAMRPHST